MMLNIPQIDMYSDWKSWAGALSQELQELIDTGGLGASGSVSADSLILPDGADTPLRLGYIFGAQSGGIVADERYGVLCDGINNDLPGLLRAKTDVPPGGRLIIPWGRLGLCTIPGAVGFDIDKSCVLDCSSGVTFYFPDANSRYLRLLADDIDAILPRVYGGTPTVRTAFGGGIHIQGKRISVYRPKIKNVAGTIIYLTGSEDCQIIAPDGDGSLADGMHTSNNQGPCKRCKVIGGSMRNTGDDAYSIVSYIPAGASHEDIIYEGFNAIDPIAAGITVAGMIGGYVKGTVTGAKGPYAMRFEADSAFSTLQNIGIRADTQSRDALQTGGLIGAGNLRCQFNMMSETSGLGGGGLNKGIFIGSNSTNNRTTDCKIQAKATDAGGSGVEVNGTRGCTISSQTDANGGHGLIVGGNNNGMTWPSIQSRNNSQSSAGSYNNVFFVTGPTDVAIGNVNSVDDQTSATINEAMRVTGCTRLTVGPYVGMKSGAVKAMASDSGGGANVGCYVMSTTAI